MKYKDIDKNIAREVCRAHHKKDKKGNIRAYCDSCPLRRTRTDKEGKIHNLFCWFVLIKFFDDVEEEKQELEQEELQYEKEWNDFINKLESVEK